MRGAQEGYCAFSLALIADYQMTVEEAFDYLAKGYLPTRLQRRLELDEKDVKDMMAMKNEGLTYTEIAECYGIHRSAIHRKIKQHTLRSDCHVGY